MSDTYLPSGLPVPDQSPGLLESGFWAATKENRLTVQRCSDCGTARFPAEWVCGKCYSANYSWTDVSPTGKVYTFARVWHPVHPALVGHTPYMTIVVELDDEPTVRLVGDLLGDPLEDVALGTPVTAVFEEKEDATIVNWQRS